MYKKSERHFSAGPVDLQPYEMDLWEQDTTCGQRSPARGWLLPPTVCPAFAPRFMT